MEEKSSLNGISQLPEPMRHHILSFLTEEEAAKTCLLSKSWQSTWRTRPNLDLSYQKYFRKELKQSGSVFNSSMESRRYNEFCTFIKETLQRYRDRNMVLNTLKLVLPFYATDGTPVVEECTRLALNYGVKNLEFGVYNHKRRESLGISLEVESLVGLDVHDCKLRMEQEIKCHRLKSLRLGNLFLDDGMLHKVISSCPLIEIIEINRCHGFKDINLTRFVSNLKQLCIIHTDESHQVKVGLEAPNLEFLYCGAAFMQDKPLCLSLKNSSRCRNLKALSLTSCVYDDFFDDLGDKFPHIEVLTIGLSARLRRIKISSHSLREIRMEPTLRFEEAQFDVPSLDHFAFICSKFPTLSFTAPPKINNRVSYILVEHYEDVVDSSWFIKLKEFLANLVHSEISLGVKLSSYKLIVLMDQISCRAPDASPLDVKQLSVHIHPKTPESHAKSVMDGLFWVCRPKTIVPFKESIFSRSYFTIGFMIGL